MARVTHPKARANMVAPSLIGKTFFMSTLISTCVYRLATPHFEHANLGVRMAAGAPFSVQRTCKERSRRSEVVIENTAVERKRKIKGPAHSVRKQLSARGSSQHPDQSERHTSRIDVSEPLGDIAAHFRSTAPECDRSRP